MAFTPATLSAQVDSIAGGSLRIYGYRTSDSDDTVTAADYVRNARKLGLRIGDMLIVYAADATYNRFGVLQSISAAGHGTLRIDRDFIQEYASIASAGLAVIPSAVPAIHLQGYFAAGDQGGGFYVRVNSEPSHPGKVQSHNGLWFELSEPRPRLAQFGGVSGAANANTAFANGVAYALATGRHNLGIDPWDHQITVSRSITTALPFELWGARGVSRLVPHGNLSPVLALNFTGADSNAMTLRDFRMAQPVGGSAGGGALAFNIVQGNGGLIEGVWIGEGGGGTIFDTGFNISGGSVAITWRELKITGTNGYGIRAATDYSAQENKFYNCQFLDCGIAQSAAAVTLLNGGGTGVLNDILFEGCGFAACHFSIEMQDTVGLNLVSCNFETPNAKHFHFVPGTLPNTALTMIGCSINGDPLNGPPPGAMAVNDLKNATFKGNALQNVDISFDATCSGITCRAEDNYVYNSTFTFAAGANAGDWTTATPAVSGGGVPGAFAATATVRYKQNDKVCEFEGVITVTNVGTATNVTFNVPVTPAAALIIEGVGANGLSYHLDNLGSGANVILYKYDGTTPVTAQVHRFSGSYRTA